MKPTPFVYFSLFLLMAAGCESHTRIEESKKQINKKINDLIIQSSDLLTDVQASLEKSMNQFSNMEKNNPTGSDSIDFTQTNDSLRIYRNKLTILTLEFNEFAHETRATFNQFKENWPGSDEVYSWLELRKKEFLLLEQKAQNYVLEIGQFRGAKKKDYRK